MMVRVKAFKNRPQIWNSLRVRVLSVVFVTCIPILLLLLGINYYSINLIEKRIYKNNREIIRLNMDALDAELNNVSAWLANEVNNWEDTTDFLSADPVIKERAALAYGDFFMEKIDLFDYVEGLACYAPANGNKVYRFTNYSADYASRMAVMDYVQTNADQLQAGRSGWTIHEINRKNMLLFVASGDGVLFYAWTSFDTLAKPMMQLELNTDTVCVFSTIGGQILNSVDDPEIAALDYSQDFDEDSDAGPSGSYIVAGVRSGSGYFKMLAVMDREKLLGTFYTIRVVLVAVVFVFTALLIPWLLYSLGKSVFKPISRMEAGMVKVEAGDMDVQIENHYSSNEIAHLIDNFNAMLRQLKTLKIQVYEDALQRRQLEMDYLQLQLEPHFYINGLNLVNLMAQMGDTDLIVCMTDHMSSYLRYITSTRNGKTTLKNELTQIEHYVKIMEIRLGECFTFIQDADMSLGDFVIPPLCIQLLVENSMKYAVDITRENTINLCVKKWGDGVEITVWDNGKGFDEAYLQQFLNDESPKGSHIGLWNLKMRLQYMYKGAAAFEISNRPSGGAMSRICIPYDPALKLETGSEKDEYIDC